MWERSAPATDLFMLLPVEQLLASCLFPSHSRLLGGYCKGLEPGSSLLFALWLFNSFLLLQHLWP